MSMNLEFLKPALGDELYEQVVEKLKDAKGITIVNTADGSYVPKSKFDDERNVSKGYKAQIEGLNTELTSLREKVSTIDTLNAQIAQLQKDAEGNEELKKQLEAMKETAANIDTLNGQIAKLQADIKSKDEAMSDQKLTFAIRDGARDAKAKNPDVVVRMIDKSKIHEENGVFTGLNEQFEALRASDSYLFDGEEKDEHGDNGGVDPHNDPDDSAPGSNASVNEMIRRAAGWGA